MSFGENLRYYRKQKKLTQGQLADLINAKHNSVSDWELDKNSPDPDTIELILGVLEIEPNQLFSSVTTLAAHKTSSYDEQLTDDEAAAVRAFLETYRKHKG